MCDNCTQTLLDTIDEIMYQFEINLEGINLHDLKAPWFQLNELSNFTDHYEKRFDELFEAVDAVDNFNDIGSDEVGSYQIQLIIIVLINLINFLVAD